MLKNAVLLAVRRFRTRTAYTLLTLAGLVVGVTACLLIGLFVRSETSYDEMHARADRTYRVTLDAQMGANATRSATTAAPTAEALLQSIPEIESATRVDKMSKPFVVQRGEARLVERALAYTDSTFFDVFSFPLIEGDPKTALAQPGSVVLTATAVQRYFDAPADAMGRTLVMEGDPYTVTGIMEDLPPNTHLSFEVLASLQETVHGSNPSWGEFGIHTYVVLQEGAAPEAVQSKFPKVVETNIGPQLRRFFEMTYAQFQQRGGYYHLLLQPVTDIHLHSDLKWEMTSNGSANQVYVFVTIALLVLLIACVNYTNMAITQSVRRAREVGLRKAFGASRSQLVAQLLGESTVMAALGFGLALALSAALLPVLNGITGLGLRMDVPIVLGVGGVVVVCGVLAGAYPAYLAARFDPSAVLRLDSTQGTGRVGWLRKSLIVTQFVISIALVVATLVVQDQLDFVANKPVGFDQEQVVVVHNARSISSEVEAVAERLRLHPEIASVSTARDVPVLATHELAEIAFRIADESPRTGKALKLMYTDSRVVHTLGLTLLAGRTFDPDRKADAGAFLLNETAARRYGWSPSEAVGKRLQQVGNDDAGTVLGVVEDFHFRSLRESIRPLAIRYGRTPNFIAARLASQSAPGVLDDIQSHWSQAADGQTFQYSFLDREFQRLHRTDQLLGYLFGSFAGLALLIACLGLFGISASTVHQRAAELGVRRALGATSTEIAFLVIRQFLAFVSVAFLIAAPLAYWAMDVWLRSFAYRVPVDVTTVLGAGLVALLTAVGTVAYHAYRASQTDPAEALRCA